MASSTTLPQLLNHNACFSIIITNSKAQRLDLRAPINVRSNLQQTQFMHLKIQPWTNFDIFLLCDNALSWCKIASLGGAHLGWEGDAVDDAGAG